jgi:hypothetical protein
MMSFTDTGCLLGCDGNDPYNPMNVCKFPEYFICPDTSRVSMPLLVVSELLTHSKMAFELARSLEISC